MLTIEKGHDSVTKTFRLPVELVDKLGKIATTNKISLNNLVIQCLNYALDNIEQTTQKHKK